MEVLPFYNLTNIQMKQLYAIKRPVLTKENLPSPDELNFLFKNKEGEKDNVNEDQDSVYFANNGKYIYILMK